MALTYHQTYLKSSPYYASVVAKHGRTLSPEALRAILAEHGVTFEDYLADDMHSSDALVVVMWLGY